MTLILSAITPDYLVQVSDRRLTYEGLTNQIETLGDSYNKAVVYISDDACVSFSFTGKAEIDGKWSDIWLADMLWKYKNNNFETTIGAIIHEANIVFETMLGSRSLKRIAFVGVGWWLKDNVRRPFFIIITNAQNDDLSWKDEADNTFRSGTSFHLPYVISSGYTLSNLQIEDLKTTFINDFNVNRSPISSIQILIDKLLGIAETAETVGKNLMVCYIPVSADGGLVTNLDSSIITTRSNAISTYYFDGVNNTNRIFFPNYVCPVVAMKKVNIRTDDSDGIGCTIAWDEEINIDPVEAENRGYAIEREPNTRDYSLFERRGNVIYLPFTGHKKIQL
jgi:hypothetical protein